ncbi:MAG: PD-(D/E)XK nuclease family protein, partial [Pseudohongiellaceae bacterium]
VHDDAETRHPFLDLLACHFGELPEVSLMDWVQGVTSCGLQDAPDSVPQQQMRLPGLQRVWRLPEGTTIPKREQESFSSLEAFLYGPYLWVLRYPARIRPGALMAVSDNNALKGSVAHQLFEDYFTAHQDIAAAAIDQVPVWCRARLQSLLEAAGAVLLMSGRAAEREAFIQGTIQGLQKLLEHLQQAGIVSVSTELSAEGTFTGGTLIGSMDLLTRTADGREAIIDIKWGRSSYRRQALAEDRYLQLAIYAILRRQVTGTLPAVGYFMIPSCELVMLASDPPYFLHSEQVVPASGEKLLEFWQRVEHSWRERRGQLDKGLIEVNVEGTLSDEQMLLDAERGISLKETFERFSEFGALTGWQENA